MNQPSTPARSEDLAWLRRFLVCSAFTPPASDIQRALRIVDEIAVAALCVRSEMREWIDVADGQLPRDEGQEVLTWTITGHCVAAYPLRIRNLHAEAKNNGEDCFYTHWQPMPKGPTRG